jgi:putative ABC transport system permease protein
LSPGARLDHVATLEQIVSNSMTRPRMYTVLVALFSGIAGVLAALGLYGVMAYAVTQRTREIGVRVALGAQRRDVVGLIVRESAALIAIGLGSGLAAASLATRYLRDLLFGLTPLDPVTFASVAGLLAAVALFAAYIPARRATSIDPLAALRQE